MAIGLLVVGAIAVGFAIRKSGSKSPLLVNENQTTETNKKKNAGGGFVGSLSEALKLGTAMKCSWKDANGNSGLAYVDNKKVYYEFNGQEEKTYMISKDNCVWTWNDQENQGLEMCYQPEEGASDFEIPETGSINTAGYEFKCLPDTVADSMFAPPTDKTFSNPSSYLPQGIEIPNQ